MYDLSINNTVPQISKKIDFNNGYQLVTASYIGPDNIIEPAGKDYAKGHTFILDGSDNLSAIIQSSVTEKIQSDQSKLTLTYKTLSKKGGSAQDDYISRTWAMTMTQYEFPLERYLSGESAGRLHSWDETDYDHKSKFMYYGGYSIGASADYWLELSNDTMAYAVAKKKWSGMETVLRFYPQAQRITQYENFLSSGLSSLNYIDSTPEGVFHFGGEWLKSGYDWTQNPDGTWTLTESWINSEKWDKDLYTLSNHWQFVNTEIS